MITAKKIEPIVNSKSIHLVYREDGIFYNLLRDFPGTLFDINGYLILSRESDYFNNEKFKRGVRLNIKGDISQIRGYQRYTEEQRRRVLELQ